MTPGGWSVPTTSGVEPCGGGMGILSNFTWLLLITTGTWTRSPDTGSRLNVLCANTCTPNPGVSAIVRMTGDPASALKVNPQVPSDLVIDHSVQVDAFNSGMALRINAEHEFARIAFEP